MIRSDDWISELHLKEDGKPDYLDMDKDGDFYWDKGKIVMTEQYHIKRGNCCGSRCKECPYLPPYHKGNTKLKTN